MASAAVKALKEVRTAFEEGLLDEEHYSVFRNLFVESRTRILERDGRGEAVGIDLRAAAESFLDRVGGDCKVEEVLPSASLDPEEPEEPNPKADKVEEKAKASPEEPSVPRTAELVDPILRAPISPAPRPRRMRSSPVFSDPTPKDERRSQPLRREPDADTGTGWEGRALELEAVGSDTLMAAAEGFLDRVGGDRKVDEVSPSASPGPEEPELTMVEENTKASLEGPSVPRTPELVGPISRAPISPAPRPRRVRSSPVFFDPVPKDERRKKKKVPPGWGKRRVRSSPVFFDPVPSKRVKRAREDGQERKQRAKSKAKSKSPPRCRDNGCSKCRYLREGCLLCSKTKSDAYLNREREDNSKLFSWIFRVLKDAGEGGLHKREICSRIAKQTDISALTTEEPRSAIGKLCSHRPFVFAKVGKKGSGRYRMVESYL
eukprot:CAMPEP_0197513400 /NCGR_PEP_ID=MMETSP1312-20131121/80726_1 /TAXON_ID=464262 /ORGANISM="Genus nov. species nov., Strain RCC2335" /LENGTH=432 /DNA_ID=CAMNT_0043061531 /DNA_START=97 /DNA_END=1397 /DNA_ORIENTATION=+